MMEKPSEQNFGHVAIKIEQPVDRLFAYLHEGLVYKHKYIFYVDNSEYNTVGILLLCWFLHTVLRSGADSVDNTGQITGTTDNMIFHTR